MTLRSLVTDCWKQEFFKTKYKEEMEAHPELEELEEGGASGSTAPSVAESTPQPTSSSGTRIKIITSAARAEANGAKSVAQSDDD